MSEEIDYVKYRAALAGRRVTQRRVAQALGMRPSTLSSWIVGAVQGQPGWIAKVEYVLRLAPGVLHRTRATGQKGGC